jgi:adenine-specific DNA-methyltransferase
MNTQNSESNNNKLDVISNTGLKSFIEYNQSVRSNTELLDSLKKTLSQFVDSEGNFKIDKFIDELKENNIAETRDGYKLGFVGKDYARLQTGCKPETMIAPDINHNSKKENINSNSIFIIGDNLEVLRHLQNAYAGKIKMIYIDPPYNTGKEFVYNDTFEFNDEKLKSLLGYGEDEIKRLKLIQGKSSHSAWLTFMYPRLKLAQKLLTDDGVIFISIDDNEQANLKLLLDDVFGEWNFVSCIIWQDILITL